VFRKSASLQKQDRRQDTREVSLAVVREYQSEVAARREQPYPRAAGMTVHVLTGALIVGLIFAYFSRIDRVVTSASGALVTADPPLVYQSLDPSVIRSLNVKEGQRVGKGQLLATLDPTFVSAQVNQLRAQTDGLRAQIARDQALIALAPLNYPDPINDQTARFQSENLAYYNQQLAQYKASMNSFDQKIATLHATIDKYKVDEARYAKEVEANSEIEKMRITLEEHGTGSMLNLLNATAVKIETQRQADFSHNSRIEAEHTLASTEADQRTYVEQFKGAASQDLLTARNTLETTLPQLDAALKHQELVRWTAPEDCIVLSVAPHMSVGSVVQQGATVISLMPVREKIEAMIQVTTDQIAFVRPGDPVNLKIAAFNSSEHGTLEGAVKWIGDDASSTYNNQPVAPYYDVEVTIDRNKLVNVPAAVSLLPGMTLSADIKVGSRSIWDYLIGGMMRGVGESMREP
jgi:membrane fusion protein, hemolysin D